MLGCIQPMSSPMMKRMLGFCCCCATADVLATVPTATNASRASHNFRKAFYRYGGRYETSDDRATRTDRNLRVGISQRGDRCADGRNSRRRRRELLAPRLLREPRGVSAATRMLPRDHLLSHQRVRRSRRRPCTRVRDRQNPPQSDRECERKPPSESRSRLSVSNLHVRNASLWRAAYCGC